MRAIKCQNCGFSYAATAERCPDCGTHKPKGREKQEAAPASYPLGYATCSWKAAHEQCLYPGTMSTGTRGEGPWFCRGHFLCTDPVMGADIVQASKSYVYQRPGSDLAKLQAEARQFCHERGLYTVPQMRAWIRQNIGNIGKPKFSQEEPDEPGSNG